MFKSSWNLEKKGVYFLNTFTNMIHGNCWVYVVNMGSEGIFLSAGLRVGKVSSASIDLSKFINTVSENEINIGESSDINE